MFCSECKSQKWSEIAIKLDNDKTLGRKWGQINHCFDIEVYYKVGCLSKQDEPNPGLKFRASRAWKTALRCLLGITHFVSQKNSALFPQNPLSTKLARSRWLEIGLVLFLLQNNKLGQYPAIETSGCVNNPYIYQPVVIRWVESSLQSEQVQCSLKITVYLQIDNFLEIWIFGSNNWWKWLWSLIFWKQLLKKT